MEVMKSLRSIYRRLWILYVRAISKEWVGSLNVKSYVEGVGEWSGDLLE